MQTGFPSLVCDLLSPEHHFVLFSLATMLGNLRITSVHELVVIYDRKLWSLLILIVRMRGESLPGFGRVVALVLEQQKWYIHIPVTLVGSTEI